MAVEKTKPLPEGHAPLDESAGFEPSRVDEQERSLGRYELVYEIGHGGMANVYLARATGPAGFQKWFAIKRVHDQLAKNRAFVDMFLDEARIAAAIQHPNVAHVFDLGEADGRYFLAMEYLHGEPLTAVASRAVAQGGHVDRGLAAYVVARAADGLHHAHEATDAQGQPMDLVHRDVSPHNIFVTYDGQVKVMDFGVAKAAGRITDTETGVVKGKLAYASPEQLSGATLDRRSDVFALGIVLWEITVGRRLFKASNDAQTLHRIHTGYRVSPRSLDPEFPDALEAIIDRALAHEVEDRYATAAEMGRDLDRFLATSELPAGSTVLASTMREWFAPEIAAKESTLYGSQPSEPGSLEVDVDALSEPSHSALRAKTQTTSEVLEAAPPTSSRAWQIGALLALLVLAAGAGAWWLGRPAQSQVRIDSSPGGAAATLDGERIDGTTPLLLEAIDEGSHRLALTLDGHAPLDVDFEARGDRVELHYALTPVAVEAPAPDPIAEPEPEPLAEPVAEPEPTEAEPATAPVASPRRARGSRQREVARPAPGRGTLTLITRPWARVWINGEDAGNTPIFRRPVPAGAVRLRLQPEGEGPTLTRTVRVPAGETISRNLDLSR